MEMSFTVPGKPRGKARARVVTQNGKTHAYTPKLQSNYEMAIKYCFWDKYGFRFRPLTVPVHVEIYARFASKETGPAMCTPDADNIIKIVGDALNGVVYADDRQVTFVSCEKWYGTDNEVEVVINAKEG